MVGGLIINIFKVILWLCAIILAMALLYPVGYFVLGKPSNDLIPQSSEKMTYKGVASYIINLDSSKERYEYVRKPVADVGFAVKRISAVNGRELSEAEVESKLDLGAYQTFLGHAPKRGTIGCSLSHIKTWQKFLESDFEFALIFEDDVKFEPGKLRQAIDELVRNQDLWDISSFEIWHRGLPMAIKSFANGNELSVYLANVSHTGAYMINRKVARVLLSRALPIKMPVDHYFTRSWELGLKFTGIEKPRLVHQLFGDSDIEITHSINDEKLDVIKSIKRVLYHLQTNIIRLVYNLVHYIKA